ncbi:MAG: peptide ABC transporter substrate-binding protein [Chthoniobacterales bacterium]
MNSTRALFSRLLSICGTIALLASCDPATPRADLIFINGAEPETLDPAIITGQPEGRIVSSLFEGLLRVNSKGQPTPGMAESWQISPDARTYTFKIRPNAQWSNGQPVTAHDFVNSWHRTLHPTTGSLYNYQLFYIKNARDFAEGKIKNFDQVGIKALDDHTLQVTLENPTPFFLSLCAFPTLAPVPTDLINRIGDNWVKPENIITNGPYLLKTWRINDVIQLEKNETYWDADHTSLRTIDILPISKANTAFNFYASGQADLVMDKGLAPPSILDVLMQRPDFHAAPFLGNYFLRYNCTRGPFADDRIRKAFSMVIDKEAIVQRITRAGEQAATALVPPGIEGYLPGTGLPYDPEKARKLLTAAGYPGGKNFPLTTYLYSEGELNEAIAVELQNMWRQELGINVNLARQEWKVYLNSLSQIDYDIARSSWVGDYPDPNTFLDMFVTGGGNNRTGWSSKTYDNLIAQAATQTNPSERFQTLQKAETQLLQDGTPICPIYFYVGIQFYNPEQLGGIEGNILDEHPLREMYRKKTTSP